MKSIVKDAEIYYIPNYVNKKDADKLLHIVNDNDKFRNHHLYFYDKKNKEIKIYKNHRKSYWFGNHAQAVQKCRSTFIDYDTNETIHIPTDFVLPYNFPNEITNIKNKIENNFNMKFNSCLVGKFDSPTDKIAYHSDASDNLGPCPLIGSLSLGKSRDFKIKSKTNKKEIVIITLHHGDLLIMGKNANTKYLHSVPADEKCNSKNFRINLTFRNYTYFTEEKNFSPSV